MDRDESDSVDIYEFISYLRKVGTSVKEETGEAVASGAPFVAAIEGGPTLKPAESGACSEVLAATTEREQQEAFAREEEAVSGTEQSNALAAAASPLVASLLSAEGKKNETEQNNAEAAAASPLVASLLSAEEQQKAS